MSRRVLVTGASRGIGREIAIALGRAGFDVVVHFHSRVDAAKAVAAAIQRSPTMCRTIANSSNDAIRWSRTLVTW